MSKVFARELLQRLWLVPAEAVCWVIVAAGAFGVVHPSMAQVGIGPIATARPSSLLLRDRPFQGMIALAVNATDTDHQIFAVRETIPVQSSGDFVLFYPEWETGSHAATSSVAELAGLVVRIDGRRTEWRRDPVDVHAFHLDVPSGARAITLEFQFLAPRSAALLRPDIVDVRWHRMLLYPAGWYVRDIPVVAQLTLPQGLHAFTALTVAHVEDDTLVFAPVTLEVLADAPVYAGRYWRQFDLAPDTVESVRLDMVADAPADLAIPPEEVSELKALVMQTSKIFGPGLYRHYDALLSLSDGLSPGGGIEHREEGEINLPKNYFTDLPHQLNNRDLLAHEYVHSWNGCFRQPADLWSPNFNLPVQGSLLWVYEGQAEFWGRVLAARAGLRSRQDTLDKLALDAASVANRSGRAWKSLADSTNDALYMAGRPVVWRDWQRREDYYSEGVLLWLDVDARLRELSGGKRGLDDFANRFFATGGRRGTVTTYTFQDVCGTLNAVARDDWESFLHRHLDTHDEADAMAGLARADWQLVYEDVPSETFRQDEAEAGARNLDYSIGLQVRSNGVVRSVVWNSPAFKAGLAPGAQITKVNGQRFSLAALETAVRKAAATSLTLTIKLEGRNRIAPIAYNGTLRYPRLSRVPHTADRLSVLLTRR